MSTIPPAIFFSLTKPFMISPTLASFSADIPSAAGVEVGKSPARAGEFPVIERTNKANDDSRTNRFMAILPVRNE